MKPSLVNENTTPWPSGPYAVVTSKTGAGNGLPNIYIAGADGKKLAAVWGQADQRFDTAHLMAAAPAMYAALKGLLEAYCNERPFADDPDDPDCPLAASVAHAAIAKVEGN